MKPKGIILACLLCCFTLLPIHSQLTVGGFLDLNIAGLNVKPGGTGEDYSSLLGFGIGGIVSYPLNNNFALQGEPMFLQKGGKLTEFDETFTLRLLYFDIPVFIRYNIAMANETVLPYVILGPNLGFRTSSKVVYPDGSSEDISDQFTGIDLGLGIGAGVDVPYNNLIFFGETRYVFGLNDINAETDADESKVRNRGLQILLGVKVPLDL